MARRRTRRSGPRPIGFQPKVIKPPQFLGFTPTFWIGLVFAIAALVALIMIPDSISIEEPEVAFDVSSKQAKWDQMESQVNQMVKEAQNPQVNVKSLIKELMESEIPTAYKRISRSVVAVQAAVTTTDEEGVTQTRLGNPQSGFFFLPEGKMSNEGYVLTTYDAINGASYNYIITKDFQTARAEIIGGDPDTNIAVIKVNMDFFDNTSQFRTIELAQEVEIGEPVFVSGVNDEWAFVSIQNGGTQPATKFYRGALSNETRFFRHRLANGKIAGKYASFYQISAPMGDGAEGGPTCNSRGEVVAVNMDYLDTPYLSNEFGISYNYVRGVCFSLPIGHALKIANEIISTGTVERSYIGVDFQIIMTQDMERKLIVSYVEPGSPAEEAGLEAGDELLAVGPSPVKVQYKDDLPALWMMLAELPLDKQVSISIDRNGSKKSLNVTPASMKVSDDFEFSCDIWGMTLKPLTAREQSKRGMKGTKGFFVSYIEPDGRANEAGLRVGDIVVGIEGKLPEGYEGLKQLYEDISADARISSVFLKVIRSGFTRFYLVKNSRKLERQQ